MGEKGERGGEEERRGISRNENEREGEGRGREREKGKEARRVMISSEKQLIATYLSILHNTVEAVVTRGVVERLEPY